jgi:hypothetical protein
VTHEQVLTALDEARDEAPPDMAEAVTDASALESKPNALAAAPITRPGVDDLLIGSWARRHRLRLADPVYIELRTGLIACW